MQVKVANLVLVSDRSRTRRLLGIPASGRYLTATTISTAGDWLTTLAIGVVLFQITGSGAAPAAFVVVRSVPRLAGPAMGGMLADRWPPARVAATLAVIQGLLTLALVPAVGHRAVWAIFAVVAAAQLVGAAARPMANAILPHLAPPDEQRGLAAVVTASIFTCMLAAPPLGLLILRGSGAQTLILLDVATFAVAALAYLTLSTPNASGPPIRATPGAALRGIRPMLRDPVLRLLTSVYLGGAILVSGVQAAIVVIAAERFGSADVSGALYSAVGIGGVLGSVVAFAARERVAGRRMIVIFYLGESISLTLITVVGGLIPAMALLAISSAASIGYTTASLTEVGNRLEPSLRGRGAAVLYFAMFGGQVIGAGTTAVFIAFAGWRVALLACLAVGALSVAAAFLLGPQHDRPGRRRRRPLRARLRRRPMRVLY